MQRIFWPLFSLCALIFVAVAGWQIGGRLSSDAIGMALGLIFGIIAGIPAALMVLAVRRHDINYDDDYQPRRERRQNYQPQKQFEQPPIIIVTGHGHAPDYPHDQHAPTQHDQLTGPVDAQSHRQFRIVGERDDAGVELW